MHRCTSTVQSMNTPVVSNSHYASMTSEAFSKIKLHVFLCIFWSYKMYYVMLTIVDFQGELTDVSANLLSLTCVECRCDHRECPAPHASSWEPSRTGNLDLGTGAKSYREAAWKISAWIPPSPVSNRYLTIVPTPYQQWCVFSQYTVTSPRGCSQAVYIKLE